MTQSNDYFMFDFIFTHRWNFILDFETKKKKNVDVSIDDSKWMNSLLRFIILMLMKKTDEERKKYNADKMITPV